MRVEADGSALVDVLTVWSLAQPSPARLGAFRGRLPAATLEALATVAAASRERAPSGPFAGPPGTVVRMVSAGGERPVLAIGDEARLAALDRDIAEAAMGALADPIAAIVAEARTGDGGPVIALRAIGMEPFRLLLFASDTPGFWARTWIDTAAGQQPLDFEDVQRLVAAGAIPDGPSISRPARRSRSRSRPGQRPGRPGLHRLAARDRPRAADRVGSLGAAEHGGLTRRPTSASTRGPARGLGRPPPRRNAAPRTVR